MTDIEVKLNWFERHLNWTYAIISMTAVGMLPFLILLIMRLYSWAWVLAVLMILVIVSSGIWVIIRKGWTLWLAAAALWPFVPAIVAGNLPSADFFGAANQLFQASLTLYVGMIINVITLLCLSNKRHKQIVLNENGKRVERWYKIVKPDKA
jgi:hypothetical protein